LLLAGAILLAATPSGASAADPEASASGLKLGRIPKCPDSIIRGIDRPFNQHEKGRIRRFFRCINKGFKSSDEVVEGFIDAVTFGDPNIACRLLTTAEWERIGGHECPQLVQDARTAYAGRSLHIEGAFIGLGRQPEAEYTVYLDDPRDGILLELGVVHNHWRIDDTNNFFP
jgi:hypothetical protein